MANKPITILDDLVNLPGMEFVKRFVDNRELIFNIDSPLIRQVLINRTSPNLKPLRERLYSEAMKTCGRIGRPIIKAINRKVSEICQTIDEILFYGPLSFTATEEPSSDAGMSGFGTPVRPDAGNQGVQDYTNPTVTPDAMEGLDADVDAVDASETPSDAIDAVDPVAVAAADAAAAATAAAAAAAAAATQPPAAPHTGVIHSELDSVRRKDFQFNDHLKYHHNGILQSIDKMSKQIESLQTQMNIQKENHTNDLIAYRDLNALKDQQLGQMSNIINQMAQRIGVCEAKLTYHYPEHQPRNMMQAPVTAPHSVPGAAMMQQHGNGVATAAGANAALNHLSLSPPAALPPAAALPLPPSYPPPPPTALVSPPPTSLPPPPSSRQQPTAQGMTQGARPPAKKEHIYIANIASSVNRKYVRSHINKMTGANLAISDVIEVSNKDDGKTFKVTVPEDKKDVTQTIWAEGIIAELWKPKTFQGQGPAAQSSGSRGPRPHVLPGQQPNSNGQQSNKQTSQRSQNRPNQNKYQKSNRRDTQQRQDRPDDRSYFQQQYQQPEPYWRDAQRAPMYDQFYGPPRPIPYRREDEYWPPHHPEHRFQNYHN